MTIQTRYDGLYFIDKDGKETGPFDPNSEKSRVKWDITFNPTSTQNAIEYLSDQFKKDPFYAYTWHCAVAMAFFDTMNKEINKPLDLEESTDHTIANLAAARFMKQAFGVDVDWKGILNDNQEK